MSQKAPHRRRIEQYPPYRISLSATADRTGRLGDPAIALMLLVLTLPLMVFVALAIKYESRGPVLIRQTRIGRGGRRFHLLRFRTKEYHPEELAPVWALKTTRIGQFLHKTRIEDLPQLINVLRGEISIIDPDGRYPRFFD
jgi:lipopolysaccharide/colanic/teichoic acid biosynthesis glycosyltransferase